MSIAQRTDIGVPELPIVHSDARRALVGEMFGRPDFETGRATLESVSESCPVYLVECRLAQNTARVEVGFHLILEKEEAETFGVKVVETRSASVEMGARRGKGLRRGKSRRRRCELGEVSFGFAIHQTVELFG